MTSATMRLPKGLRGYSTTTNGSISVPSSLTTLPAQPSIPANEIWLYVNSEARAALTQGIEDARAGRVSKMPSFAEFADLDLDD